MAFRMNSSKASEGGISLKPEGDYEVIIDSAETKTIQSSGKQCVSLTYIIRNDVQQPCQNGLIFNSIWKKKEPNADDMSVDGYNFGQLMAVAAAAKLPLRLMAVLLRNYEQAASLLFENRRMYFIYDRCGLARTGAAGKKSQHY